MKKDYDFIVGFTLFNPSGFKTRFRHFDNLKVAEMFCENRNLKNNSKIYVDYDYFKEDHKETIAECYYKCSELWQNKIFTKIREIENECKKCRFKESEICKELCQNSQCVQGECLKVLNSLSR